MAMAWRAVSRLTRLVSCLRVLLLCAAAASAQPAYSLDRLQGAWWSSPDAPTADFYIQGEEVWLDYDAAFHPCGLVGDILIFHLPGDMGPVEQRILRLDGDELVLQHLMTLQETVYTRK